MWVWVQFILLVRKPQATVCVKHFFAQRRKEFLEQSTTVDPSPSKMCQIAENVKTQKPTLLVRIGR